MESASTTIEEVPVFIDTSLQTHIVISVSPDLTAEQFKRKFEIMHLGCYPAIGYIKVDGLMVKKRSHLYHLPESMPIKHVFQGSRKTWFLYAQVSSTPESEVVQRGLSENKTEYNCQTKTKVTDLRPSSMEPTSERMSQSISVSGIIKKYFSVFDDEVTSSSSKPRVPSYAPKTPPTITKVGGSRDKKRPSAIGKRLIVAANNLGISTSDKKPVISLCKHKYDKLSVPKSSSIVRHPVFEIGEE
ncbi:hypothetical protein M8C21_018899 [Ambrosia artemisiifolia]|uniref:Uncharacterized protein n=1 Tax=Ambrosia artemisiifolia TaxID=4212 RepID=A0AAD5C322_AMBAR|nr:hypothetical protein M8C21_018899 [Ambrosia artemisiifolia]